LEGENPQPLLEFATDQGEEGDTGELLLQSKVLGGNVKPNRWGRAWEIVGTREA